MTSHDATGNSDAETPLQRADIEGPEKTTFNLLFICTGNTCRSPMAEGIARAELVRRGWKHVEVRSAGLAAQPGYGASEPAIAVAGRYGIDLDGHRSQPVSRDLVRWADLILGMGPSHLYSLGRLGASEKGVILADFAAGGDGLGDPVRDPFGGPEEIYEETFLELASLIRATLDRLQPILAP